MASAVAPDYVERHASFERWFQTPLGRALLADQRRCVDRQLQGLSGARQLQVGLSHRLPLASGSDYSHKILTTARWADSLADGVAVCDADELPFPGDSMDLVLLHHTVDFSPYPHQVLREASRVLRGGGQMLLVGFNPVSLWGVRKLVSRSHAGPWGGRFMIKGRMEDWLSLLDFDIETAGTHFRLPPVQNPGVLRFGEEKKWLPGYRLLPVGAYYCILATKRVCAPIKSRRTWRHKQVISLPVAGTIGASGGCARSAKRE